MSNIESAEVEARRGMHGRLAAALLAIVAMILTLCVSAPAQGAVGPGGHVITCTVKFNHPHNSHHVGGNVNATVSTSCDSSVTMIRSFIRLKDLTNGRTNPSGGATTYGKTYNSASAALSCKPGVYQGSGYVEVIFPTGYSPQFQSTEGASAAIGLACNGATVAPLTAAGPPLFSSEAPSDEEVVFVFTATVND